MTQQKPAKQHSTVQWLLSDPPVFLQSLKLSSLMPLYKRRRLALKPFGGSVVIFNPRCKMEIGKSGEGLDDSHTLKDSWGLAFAKPSMILSRVGSQLVMR